MASYLATMEGYYLFHMPGSGYYWTNREGVHVSLGGTRYFKTKAAAKKKMNAMLKPNPSRRKSKPRPLSKRKRMEYGEFTEAEFRQHLRSHSGGRRAKSRKTHGNPGAKLSRTGHTGFLKAKAVDVITRGGRVVEVRVKR